MFLLLSEKISILTISYPQYQVSVGRRVCYLTGVDLHV